MADKTTRYQTWLSKNDNQVTGYVLGMTALLKDSKYSFTIM